MTGKQIVWFAIVGQAEPLRKLPGQVDTSKGDCLGVLGLGRNMRAAPGRGCRAAAPGCS